MAFLVRIKQSKSTVFFLAFLGFFREGKGSTPVFQPRTQSCMADPDGRFPKVLNSHIAPILARMFAQVPEDWRREIVKPVAKNPHNRPKAIQAQPHRSAVCKILDTILKEKLLSLLTTRQHGFPQRHSAVTNLLPAEETVT